MNLSLPDEMQAFLEAQAALEGHSSVGEYVQALIRDAQMRRAKQGLEAELREGLESGPATPMTRADWSDLERRVWERHQGSQTREP